MGLHRMAWVVEVPIWLMLLMAPFLLMMWLGWLGVCAIALFVKAIMLTGRWLFTPRRN
jgi:hypothetical protein